MIDSNISTVTAEGDKVILVDEPEPWIEQIELQAGRDVGLADRMHLYSIVLGDSHKVPVDTTVVLLRPAADGLHMSGTLEKRNRRGAVYDWFGYNVMRIWQRPVEEILAAGLPVLPLAAVADVGPNELPKVLAAISERFVREMGVKEVATLWTATRVLMGLRYTKEQVDEFTKGISAMILGIRGIEESTVYQDIFAKGEGEARRRGGPRKRARCSCALGRRTLGEADDDTRTTIARIHDVDKLNAMLERLLDASSWADVLGDQAKTSPG